MVVICKGGLNTKCIYKQNATILGGKVKVEICAYGPITAVFADEGSHPNEAAKMAASASYCSKIAGEVK